MKGEGGFGVRPAGLQSLDVRGFKGNYLLLEPQVAPADAATVFAGEQDIFAERRIAATRGRVATAGTRHNNNSFCGIGIRV